jgi:hypothetical protein
MIALTALAIVRENNKKEGTEETAETDCVTESDRERTWTS